MTAETPGLPCDGRVVHETRQMPEIPHGGRGDRGALESRLKGADVGVAGCRADCRRGGRSGRRLGVHGRA